MNKKYTIKVLTKSGQIKEILIEANTIEDAHAYASELVSAPNEIICLTRTV